MLFPLCSYVAWYEGNIISNHDRGNSSHKSHKTLEINKYDGEIAVQSLIMPVVTYRCKSQTVKRAERQRIDAFELCCWRRLPRAPWTSRISNQSILREINPEYSLEGLMLKLQPFWSSDDNSWLTGKVPDAGKDWGQEEKGMTEDEMVGWHHWVDGNEFKQTPGDGEGQGNLTCYIQSVGSKSVEYMSNWTITRRCKQMCRCCCC